MTNYYYFRIIAVVVYLGSNPLCCIKEYLIYCNLHVTQFSCFIFYSLILLIFFFFLAKPLNIWDLSSPTKEPTCTLCSGNRVITTGPPGKSLSSPLSYFFSYFFFRDLKYKRDLFFKKLSLGEYAEI